MGPHTPAIPLRSSVALQLAAQGEAENLTLLFPQQQINHPTTANMRSHATTMFENVRVLAARVHQRIGEYGQPHESAFFVNGAREINDVGGEPRGIEGDKTEGVDEDVAQKLVSELPWVIVDVKCKSSQYSLRHFVQLIPITTGVGGNLRSRIRIVCPVRSMVRFEE